MVAEQKNYAFAHKPPVPPSSVSIVILLIVGMPVLLTSAAFSVDLNYHVIRYIVLSDYFKDHSLSDHYQFDPGILPNLGMDIIGTILIFILGPEIGKSGIFLISLLAVPVGFLYLCRAIRGEVRPIDLAFVPLLAYSHIFVWGFANFLLGAGVALAGLGFWLSNDKKPASQMAGGIVVAAVLMVIHAFSFAIWGLMIAAYELGKWQQEERGQWSTLARRGFRTSVLALIPVTYFLLSRTASAPAGPTPSISNLTRDYHGIELLFRLAVEVGSRLWLLIAVPDSGLPLLNLIIGSIVVAFAALCFFTSSVSIDKRLIYPIVLLIILWALLPPNIFGSGYANDRMPLLLWGTFVSAASVNCQDRQRRAILRGVSALSIVHMTVVGLVYSISWIGFGAFERSLAAEKVGGIAVTVLNGGADRNGLLPYCSAFELLAFLKGGYAVQTFDFPSQQPVRLVGPLKKAMNRREAGFPRGQVLKMASGSSAITEPEVVRQHFAYGFDMVIVCGTNSLISSDRDIMPKSAGVFWRVYRSDK